MKKTIFCIYLILLNWSATAEDSYSNKNETEIEISGYRYFGFTAGKITLYSRNLFFAEEIWNIAKEYFPDNSSFTVPVEIFLESSKIRIADSIEVDDYPFRDKINFSAEGKLRIQVEIDLDFPGSFVDSKIILPKSEQKQVNRQLFFHYLFGLIKEKDELKAIDATMKFANTRGHTYSYFFFMRTESALAWKNGEAAILRIETLDPVKPSLQGTGTSDEYMEIAKTKGLESSDFSGAPLLITPVSTNNGRAYFETGSTILFIPVGKYLIKPFPVKGFSKPSNTEVILNAGEEKTVIIEYRASN